MLGCDDGIIRVFDIDSGNAVVEIPAHASGIKKIATSPINGDILSAAYDQKIIVWDAVTFARKVDLQCNPTTWERSFNWTPDGKHILAGTFDGTAPMWDAATGQCLREFGERGQGNLCLNDVSATGDGRFATVSDDGFVRLGRLTRDAAEWGTCVEPQSGRMLANAITIDPEYDMIVSGAHDQKLHLFDTHLSHEKEVHLGEGPINCVRIAHYPGYERQTFVACYSGAIVCVDDHGRVLDTIRVHDGAVKALRLHPSKPVGVSCSRRRSTAVLGLRWHAQTSIFGSYGDRG